MIDSSELPRLPLERSTHTIAMVPTMDLMAIETFTERANIPLIDALNLVSSGHIRMEWRDGHQFVNLTKGRARELLHGQ